VQFITLKPSPALPENKGFSKEFQDFIAICLRKEAGSRSSAADLLQHPFAL
jgi:serine/threonine protein kinase